MSDLGFNKIAAAVLATALGFMLIREAPHFMMHVESPQTPVYKLDIAEDTASGEEEIPLPFPQADWIAAMDEARGAKVFKKCTSCHNAEQGGANGTGPNLWNIVASPAAQNASFGYSSAMSSSGVTWGYEELNDYLEKPSRYLSGTAMNFIGLKKPTDRAAVIEYLRVRSDNPLPQPAVATVDMPTGDVGLESETEDTVEGAVQNVENTVNTATDKIEEIIDGTEDVLKDAAEATIEIADEAVDAGQDLLEKAKDMVDGDKE